MKRFLRKWGLASILGICLAHTLPYTAYANTGPAFGGDNSGNNLDSSTFFGDFFIPESGLKTPMGLPPNWKCLRRSICSDCDLRLETLGKMLDTNLAGTLIEKVIQGAAPRYCCDLELAERARAHLETASRNNKESTIAEISPSMKVASGNGSAALLGIIQPASVENTFPAAKIPTSPVSTELAQASSSASNRVSDLFPIEAAPPSRYADQLKAELIQSLNLQSAETVPTELQTQQAKKLQTLDDLVTTLQGLIWEENVSNNTWQRHVDVNQLAAAIKTYNELLRLLSPEELNAWRGDRNAQDITTVLKKLREGVVVQ